ncbi:uncharacterized protein LOC125039602 [Penaeus chinensis]|uniref:uncharacterized protein LOC125039602 n=1 Tax=Penaeus chinensis TaxID=139456 RepID=UPI001FB76E9F|nr:uncharacterized protein LOC125039602 [Penaeus chinensis]
MATGRARRNESDLAEMSLSDFLERDVSPPALREDFHFLARPADPVARRGRREQTRGRGSSSSRGGGGRGNRAAAPSKPRKEGVRAGVMVAHDPPPVKPLRQRNALVSQGESILTMGLHEAKKVKENVGRSEGDGDLEAVLTNGQQQEEVSFVYRQKMSFSAGQRCHFFPVADLFDVRRDTVLKLLVGLLNAGERGVVYMGVAEDGTVHGITADAQMVAQFVHGIMNTVKFYLMPRLHVPQYGVRYTNVTASSGHILNNVWVVELHAVPQMEHYYNPIMDMAYYIRQGTTTKSLSFMAFCHAIVAQTAEDMDEEVKKLQDRVTRLEKALEEAGVDISSVGPHVCSLCYFNDCPTQCYGKKAVGEEVFRCSS